MATRTADLCGCGDGDCQTCFPDIEVLWAKHYVPGITGSYHGDMASAFNAIRADARCGARVNRLIQNAVSVHLRLERMESHKGRRYFVELFGTAEERSAELSLAGKLADAAQRAI